MRNEVQNSGNKKITNVYIDGENLYKGIHKHQDWKLDYTKFYIWLKDKFRTDHIYIFLGKVPKLQYLYDKLESIGYTIIYKEVAKQHGEIKGNVDAEIVLHAAIEYFEQECTDAILVTSDGDFACLIDFLVQKCTFKRLISPSSERCSYLLRKRNISITYLDNPRTVELLKKRPLIGT